MAWTESLCRGEGFAERHRQDVIHRFHTIPSNLNPIQPSLPQRPTWWWVTHLPRGGHYLTGSFFLP